MCDVQGRCVEGGGWEEGGWKESGKEGGGCVESWKEERMCVQREWIQDSVMILIWKAIHFPLHQL